MKTSDMNVKDIMQMSLENGIVIPGFNIPHLPMMEPVVKALEDTETFGLIMVARLEWIKFQSRSIKAICEEYQILKNENFTRLHLDHIPVIDEDNKKVDFVKDISEAIELGYDSVMVDGSRLSLEENIMCTEEVVDLAHQVNIPVEAELGAVMGHEKGPLPPYEELFASAKGFTSPEEAKKFVDETGVDWLSVAIGNIHGAISEARKEKKQEARLSIQHLDLINQTVKRPLVLHGGTGIRKEYLMESFKNGISKINIATAIRQPYERMIGKSVKAAQDAVYVEMMDLIHNQLEIAGTAQKLSDL
ncbi:class II fructose-bisphosphate aldolase [uncultured Draconibacterium sp.]|uniref:class II fructose-bisphosphate aldolase n=1 Tax=uncultured Draconibacterium sp. TaxID=1573823 RepID=UPI0029C7EA6F|nr:class II fructose-bisphosphate aldolase [uncultured Draconibacterium sp.]